MPIITSSDLNTHLYPEIVTEITRGDDTITTAAIATAVQEAKLYLSKYDLLQLFGTDTVAATYSDALLTSLIKDIAIWHLLRLSNPGIDNTTAKTTYENSLKILNNIMNGQVQPDGWPYNADNCTTIPEGDSIKWTSVPKRHNYY